MYFIQKRLDKSRMYFRRHARFNIEEDVYASSTNEAKQNLSQEQASSSYASSDEREDQEGTTDVIPVGIAHDVCQGKSNVASAYQEREYEEWDDEINKWKKTKAKPSVTAMARTTIFEISKSNNLDSSINEVPTFHPLPLMGMTKAYPLVYEGEGGSVPNTPFVFLSPKDGKVKDYAFTNSKNLKELVIGENVTHIGIRAFKDCSNLTKVTIKKGSKLRHVGRGAFYSCEKLEGFHCPDSLETLEEGALEYCFELKKVRLSPKMTKIENRTFFDCSSLTTVEGMNAIQSIGKWAFRNCSSLERIDVNKSAYVHDDAFWKCNAVINYI